jgi:hypothetical protein
MRFTRIGKIECFGTWADETAPILTERIEVSRNASCLCGSGKRFKRCCGVFDVTVQRGAGNDINV